MFRVEADNYTKWLDILYNKKTIFLIESIFSRFTRSGQNSLIAANDLLYFFVTKFSLPEEK